jgi:hypothetical protein
MKAKMSAEDYKLKKNLLLFELNSLDDIMEEARLRLRRVFEKKQTIIDKIKSIDYKLESFEKTLKHYKMA